MGILRFIAGLALHCSDKHDFTANHNSEIGGITVCIIKSPISDKKILRAGPDLGDFLNHPIIWDMGSLNVLFRQIKSFRRFRLAFVFGLQTI